LIIEKTRVISESAIFGFLKEKNQQIYTEFLTKVNASIKQYRLTANKEYEKYFERKDDNHEEESNSAKLFSLTQKASAILLDADS
jgi:1,2-phenylacetyl-CoA epoxidase catalytic subunit